MLLHACAESQRVVTAPILRATLTEDTCPRYDLLAE